MFTAPAKTLFSWRYLAVRERSSSVGVPLGHRVKWSTAQPSVPAPCRISLLSDLMSAKVILGWSPTRTSCQNGAQPSVSAPGRILLLSDLMSTKVILGWSPTRTSGGLGMVPYLPRGKSQSCQMERSLLCQPL